MRSRLLTALLAAILLPAALLRLSALTASPPGVWLDEAIGALQGDALVEGRRLPDEGPSRFPRWPLWSAAEGVVARILGPTVPAARLPAALAGLLAVALAWPAARVFGGPVAGASAAAFLAGSLWHVTASRLALPCILVTVETLLVGWLLLRDEPLGPLSGAALVVVSAAAPLGYASSLVTPLLAAGLLVLRIRARGARGFRTELAVLAILVAGAAAVLLAQPDSLHRSRFIAGLGAAEPAGWLRQSGRVALNWVAGESGRWGYWHNYPAAAPRVSRVELLLVVFGVIALVRGGAPPWKRLALLGWAALALIPEVAPGEDLHLLRGLPTLAPGAIAAGCGAALLARTAGRPGAVVLAVLLAANAARTGWITLNVMPRDPVARSWYAAADREAAEVVAAAAATEPVALTPAPTCAGSPLLLFHLRGLLRTGRILGADIALADPRIERVIRSPVSGDPIIFVFRSARRLDGRPHLGISSIDGLLAYGREALATGRARDAEAHFRSVLAWSPDSPEAHGALGLALAARGRWREAAVHLMIARPASPAGSVCAVALAEAERRLGPSR
ncbi:MAG: tetratricopeptide repeat protein [Candidatus Coatesbacteria bacterium]